MAILVSFYVSLPSHCYDHSVNLWDTSNVVFVEMIIICEDKTRKANISDQAEFSIFCQAKGEGDIKETWFLILCSFDDAKKLGKIVADPDQVPYMSKFSDG
ncbi:hypothetical protein HAX54_001101 [Datura stramonium]|uniref:Uncharacterized protein n=1 Tax=Datura stramonium TaxID=4076 RepID=A0ABS8RS81_DATST|nr:hypothetical protein [Datura stramonium]